MIYLDEFTLEEISTRSPIVNEFESEIARCIEVEPKYVLATNCGTSALHLGLLAANVKPGDDVLVPVLTYGATVNAIKYVGANPVFVDVDKDTWLADFDYDLFGDDIYKFAMPVDLYGNAFPTYQFNKDVKVIVDAAESFGLFSLGCYINEHPNHFVCFSFNGNKIISTGSGGVVVNGDANSVSIMRILASQGRSKNYNENGIHHYVGYNYRMPGLNAKYGLESLKSLDYCLKRKEIIHGIYRNELKDLVEFQRIVSWSNYWMTAVLFPEYKDVESIQYRLIKWYNIPSRRIFRPLNHSEPFRDIDNKHYPVAEMIYNRGLCLPSSILNTDEDIYKVCEILRKILKG